MSYKQFQLSWLSKTHRPRLRQPINGPWSAQLTAAEETRFFRSWLVYDSELELGKAPSLTRNRLLGLVMITGISASFWTGVGFLVSRLMH